MIAEALQYLATAALTGSAHRRFVRYSVNLWSRAGRCSRDWAAHEANSKEAISTAISGLTPVSYTHLTLPTKRIV